MPETRRMARLNPTATSWHALFMATEADKPLDRFVVAATVDRLIYDSDTTFEPEDARVLLDVLPHRRTPWIELGVAGKMSGGSTRGFAAGVGNVDLKNHKDR